jgi:hypothetical protein
LHSLVRDPLLRCSEMWIISFFFFAVIPIILLVPLSLFPWMFQSWSHFLWKDRSLCR